MLESKNLNGILENLYKFYLLELDKNHPDKLRKNIHSYLLKTFDFNQCPKVLSNEKYNNLEKRELYRGVPDFDYSASLLCDENYQGGSGFISGIFTTDSKMYALGYTDKHFLGEYSNKNKILNIKYDSDNGIYLDDLEEIASNLTSFRYKNNYDDKTHYVIKTLKSFINKIEDEDEKKKFLNIFVHDVSNLAILLGIDFIKNSDEFYVYNDDMDFDHFSEGKVKPITNTIILNRGKICVSQNEFNRICENSTNYKKSNANLE